MHATIKGCFETETMKHCAETDKHSEGRQRETKHKTIKIVPILQSGSGPATSLAVGKKTQTVNEIGHLNRRSHKHCHAFDALLRRYILRRCRSRPFFVFKKVTELFPSVNMFSLGGRKKASKPGSKLASKQAPCAREPSSQTPTAPLVPEHHLRAPWPRHERCWSTLPARISPRKCLAPSSLGAWQKANAPETEVDPSNSSIWVHLSYCFSRAIFVLEKDTFF